MIVTKWIVSIVFYSTLTHSEITTVYSIVDTRSQCQQMIEATIEQSNTLVFFVSRAGCTEVTVAGIERR